MPAAGGQVAAAQQAAGAAQAGAKKRPGAEGGAAAAAAGGGEPGEVDQLERKRMQVAEELRQVEKQASVTGGLSVSLRSASWGALGGQCRQARVAAIHRASSLSAGTTVPVPRRPLACPAGLSTIPHFMLAHLLGSSSPFADL